MTVSLQWYVPEIISVLIQFGQIALFFKCVINTPAWIFLLVSYPKTEVGSMSLFLDQISAHRQFNSDQGHPVQSMEKVSAWREMAALPGQFIALPAFNTFDVWRRWIWWLKLVYLILQPLGRFWCATLLWHLTPFTSHSWSDLWVRRRGSWTLCGVFQF